MSKRDPLDSKRRRTERFRFEVEDPTAAEAAVLEARMAVRMAVKGSPAAEAAEAQLRAAGEALEACYGTVTLQALKPRVQLQFQQEAAERDAVLEAQHKAAVAAAVEAGEDEPEPPDLPEPTWTADSLEVRLIAACDVDGRSPERWAEALDLDGDWTIDDRAALLDTCYAVNTRHTFDPSVLGKGWAAKRA